MTQDGRRVRGRVRAGDRADGGRGWLRTALTVLALAGAACTVGSGAGSAKGTLLAVGCSQSEPYAKPAPYSLDPTFFAGEPIEDVCPAMMTCAGPHTNRLVIRMQRNGNSIEVNDTLYFDVENSYEVARCLRGRTVGGQPDWDTRLVTGPDGNVVPGLVWCDWTWTTNPDGGVPDAGADAGVVDAGDASDAAAGADAGAADGGGPPMTAPYARINISTNDYVRTSFSPLDTCSSARLVGIALPGSWIQFQDFGEAEQTAMLPDARSMMDPDFKVNFGDRLRATFHLVLGDDRVVTAIQMREAIPPTLIDGQLDGTFDFDLERGRAAQPFP